MSEFIQQLINGLSLGSIYALIALGYTMVYGVLRFINFAHGDVYMVGAFSGYYLGGWMINRLGMSSSVLLLIAVLIGSMIFCALAGLLIERLAYRPLRNSPRLTVLIPAIGVSLFLEFSGQVFFGADPKPFPALIPTHMIKYAGLTFTNKELIVLGVTVVLLIGLSFVVLKTKMGMAMRALSFNPTACSLMAVPNSASMRRFTSIRRQRTTPSRPRSAPVSIQPATRPCCAGVSRAGRPGSGRSRKPSMPSSL